VLSSNMTRTLRAGSRTMMVKSKHTEILKEG
jgi:hypothetical protein